MKNGSSAGAPPQYETIGGSGDAESHQNAAAANAASADAIFNGTIKLAMAPTRTG
jgi:hypothetical protein